MSEKPKYQLRIGLNVLEHLGINLYSNVPSVLSEIVANAWDADATEVRINFDEAGGVITICDNGTGMTEEEVNNRFLFVGYQRRELQAATTGLGRQPMGRKGIGKLSLFSIAGTIEISTAKDDSKNAFKMVLEKIRQVIKDKGNPYYIPEVLKTDHIDFENGTTIRLSDLRRRQTIRTPQALKKRIARRFSIIGAKENFSVHVNDEKISPTDRDYFDKLQFMWTYGEQSEVIALATKLPNGAEDRSAEFGTEHLKITGWIGTVHESGQLKDSESEENLNRLAIFVRGKMAQEDMLADLNEHGVYAGYLIGELHADFLDEDNENDAATSNRQKLVEDDYRYIELKGLIRKELKFIQSQWTKLRVDEGAKKAMEIPAVEDWVKSLPNRQQPSAKAWIGRIYKLKTNDENERKELLKHSVFAFEFHRANENLIALDNINDENLEQVMSLFKELDTLEEAFYGQIVKQRVEIIRTLQEKIDQNEKESVIQEYLFDHLWLLDPHWERIESEKFMETRVSRLFKEEDRTLTEDERLGRIDIKYRQSAGTHVVVELKKSDRLVSVADLIKQIHKYRSGMFKLLNNTGRANEPVAFVVLLGRNPKEWEDAEGPETVSNLLKSVDARIVLYDELLNNAFNCYKEYLTKSKDVLVLQGIIDAIDNHQ